MKKLSSLILALCMLAALLAGCGNTEPAETTPSAMPTEAAASQTSDFAIEKLVIGTTGSIETALRNEYNYDMLASSTTEPPLLYQDWSGNYHPLLADFSTEDSLTWTYTILPDRYWDDGVSVTAEDILFTLQYDEENGTAVFEDKTDSEGKVTKAKYAGYTLSEDRMSISLTLNSTNVREPGNMTSFRIMPKHIYEGKSEVSEAEARIGCGPYRFDSFSSEAGTVTFTANPLYPEQPQAEKLVFRIFGNEDTLYMALQNGDIDLVWNYSTGVSENYRQVLTGSSFAVVPAGNVSSVLAFNNTNGFFADADLRKAAAAALNYEQFITCFGSEDAEIPGAGFVPGSTYGYITTEQLRQDTTAAEDFMAAAGYGEKNADGFFVNDRGEEAAFTLTYNTAKEVHAGCAELIKNQLEAFGIRVELDGCDKDSYNAKTSNKFSEHNITMEAALYGYTAAGMSMGSGLGTIYVDGSHAVQGGCQVFDEAFTAALQQLASSATAGEYLEAAAKVQRYYAEELPLIALYWDTVSYAYAPDLEITEIDNLFGLNSVRNWLTIVKK